MVSLKIIHWLHCQDSLVIPGEITFGLYRWRFFFFRSWQSVSLFGCICRESSFGCICLSGHPFGCIRCDYRFGRTGTCLQILLWPYRDLSVFSFDAFEVLVLSYWSYQYILQLNLWRSPFGRVGSNVPNTPAVVSIGQDSFSVVLYITYICCA